MIYVWLLNHLLCCCLALRVYMDRMQHRDGGRVAFYHAMFVILFLYQVALIGMLVCHESDQMQTFMVYMWGLVSLTGITLLPGAAAPVHRWQNGRGVIRFGAGLLVTGLFMMLMIANWHLYAPIMGLIQIAYIAMEYNSLHYRLTYEN